MAGRGGAGRHRLGVRVLGHQLDHERAQLCGQGERQRSVGQRSQAVLSAAARAGRAPSQRLRQQRELAWVAFSADKYANQATPDDAAVKTYYDAHKSAYMTPETVDLRYLEISLSQLASKVSVDDAQLKTYYDEQKVKTPERFTAAEQRRVSHILLPVANPKDDAAVKAKAEGVVKRAQSGEDVAALAKQFSQDPG